MKIFEMFAGYGGASFALKKANIDHEVVGFSEIDKYAIQCYEQNHKGKNYGDCSNIDPRALPNFDLLTGGFPCQSFSIAGKGLGQLDTRGTLFNEIIRIAEIKKPRYMLLENVKGLMSKKHKETFDKILSELSRIGYKVYCKVLNSKEYGIPQNRERVFFVCFRDKLDLEYFEFPEKEELKIFLKDILEDEVDDKYFLSDKMIQGIINSNYRERQPQIKDVCGTLKVGGDTKCIIVKNGTKKGYLKAYEGDGVNLEQPNSKTRRGRVQKDVMGCLQTNDQRGVIVKAKTICLNSKDGNGVQPKIQNRVYSSNGISPAVVTAFMPSIETNLTIRKLTPTECFRLMGFLDDNINLENLSNTQKYKLAGNGWEINVVSKLFIEMFRNI